VASLNVTEPLNVAQHTFLPTYEAVRRGGDCFSKNQDKIIDAMQVFASGWFERRHAGVRAALKAAELMFKAEAPAELMRGYQDWANGVVQRAITDGEAYRLQLMTVATALAGPGSVASKSEGALLQAEASAAMRSNAA